MIFSLCDISSYLNKSALAHVPVLMKNMVIMHEKILSEYDFIIR